MSDANASALTRLRETPRYHWIALVGACVLGVGVASLHWTGLVVGGALVGLVAGSLRRALLAGLGFGVLALLVWGVVLVISGSPSAVAGTGQFALLAVGMALGLPLLGSLVRGVV